MNEATLNRLKDDAAELLKDFSVEYLKCFGLAIFDKIKREVDGGNESSGLKLQYRDWDSVERPEVFSGEVYMKTGEGPGSFGKWKKVYLVERQDYNIDVYPDEKASKAGKKPKQTIKTAGYRVQRDVSWHYRWEMRGLGTGLGLTEEEVKVLTAFSDYSWALTHSQRNNYVFQLHKGKDPCCGCLGGNAIEPDDVGAENAAARSDWLEFMDRSVKGSCTRDTSTVTGAAFYKTIGRMADKNRNLWGWEDDGSEADIMTDMLMEALIPNVRDDILSDLKGPVSIRIALWYKSRGMMMKALSPLTPPAWDGIQKAAKAVGDKIEPVVRAGVEPILNMKEEIKGKIRTAIVDKMGEFLAKHVSPHIKPILEFLDKPLTQGFGHGKDLFSKQVQVANLPDDEKQRNIMLDQIPRTWSATYDMRHVAADLVEPVRQFKRIDSAFDFLDPYSLKSDAEITLLTTLDAAIFTLEEKMKVGGTQEAFATEVLQDYEHDAKIQRMLLMQKFVCMILVGGFKKALSPVTEPIITPIEDMIPEDMRDILSVVALYDEIVDLFVAEPINKMVESSYS